MTGPPDQAGATDKGDDFVDRLGDRLSQEHDLPAEEEPPPAGSGETSDVHQLAAAGQDQDAFPDDAIEVPPAPKSIDSVNAFAEFEDDMEGEATRIDDSHLFAEASTSILQAPLAQPFLAVERGKDMGRDFVLQEGENGVGRGIDNDVILADVAVSRRHLKIFREGDDIRLKDLGSGNGTLLNGNRVTSATLVDGDRIELGETTLVVRLPGATLAAEDPYDEVGDATDESNIASVAPPPRGSETPSDPFAIPHGPGYQPELTPSNTAGPHLAARPSGGVVVSRPVLIVGAMGAGLLFLIMVITIGVLAFSGGGAEPEEPVVTVGSSNFDEGVREYNAQRWAEAQIEFTAALQERGSDPRVQGYLERTRIALEDQATLDRASRLREQGDLTGAFNASSEVTNPDSPLLTAARTFQGQIRTEQAGLAVGDGQRALAAGNLDEARRQLGLARDMNAQARAVRSLEQAIAAASGDAPADEPTEEAAEEVPEEAAEEAAEEVRETNRAASRRRRGRRGARRSIRRRGRSLPVHVGGRRGSTRRGSTRRRGRSTGIAASVVRTYLGGNFQNAASMARIGADNASGAEAQRLRTMQRNIESFGRLWRQISPRFNSRARRQMSQAMALDRQIAPNDPHYRNQIQGHLVRILLADAIRQRGDVVASCRSVQAAYRISASNPDVRRRSSECEATARGMLRGAEGAPRARALSIYGRVQQMVPASSSIARDARTRAVTLRRSSQTYDDDE